jgi:uncharacterized protein YecE (DUF72 family)
VAYSRAFNFVEVNSTFYQIPSLREVERWRRLVPPDFQFSVRAYRSITHEYKLQPLQEAFETFEKMKHICRILNAEILHLQTPPSFELTRASIDNLRNFFSSAKPGKLRVALEIRGPQPAQLPSKLLRTMQDHNMIHCVDLSRGETPAYESDVLYTRLFGKGKHNIYEPTDGELAEINNKVSSRTSQKVAMSFHFVRMYKDAARLKTYRQTGKFPMVTRSTGLSSLEEVLREDARFPSTKKELAASQGWKLFDVTEAERVHAKDFLQELPEGTYNNIGDIIVALEKTLNR